LADDHDVVRAGVRAILEAREGWTVIGEATNGEEAIKLAVELRPDVVVLDLEVGQIDGAAVTRQIKKLRPSVEVVIFTMRDDEYMIREVLSAGARAFVLKSEGIGKLIRAIECTASHQPYLAARASEILFNSFKTTVAKTRKPSPLTDREREIIQLLAGGSS